jgi:CheY-like chemotaxis protein
MPFSKILLVDDDEDDRHLFEIALQEVAHPITCTTLSNAKEALQKLEYQEILPDVIFTDLNMPQMDGIDFLSRLKRSEQLGHIPVYVLSTTANPFAITQTKNIGACDFFVKPDTLPGLTAMLLQVLL